MQALASAQGFEVSLQVSPQKRLVGIISLHRKFQLRLVEGYMEKMCCINLVPDSSSVPNLDAWIRQAAGELKARAFQSWWKEKAIESWWRAMEKVQAHIEFDTTCLKLKKGCQKGKMSPGGQARRASDSCRHRLQQTGCAVHSHAEQALPVHVEVR